MRAYWLLGVTMMAVLGFFQPAVLAAEKEKEKGKDDEIVTNAHYKHWASFKIGTIARQRDKVRLLDKDDPESKRSDYAILKETRYKLLSVSPEQVELEATTIDHEPGEIIYHAPFKVVYPAKFKLSDDAHTPKDKFTVFKEGDEKVKLADGKVVNTHWVETAYEYGGLTHHQTIWFSDEVPGGITKDRKVKKKGDKEVAHSSITLIDFTIP